jgi:hypothetical protein
MQILVLGRLINVSTDWDKPAYMLNETTHWATTNTFKIAAT